MKRIVSILSIITLMMNFAFVEAKNVSAYNGEAEKGVSNFEFYAPAKRSVGKKIPNKIQRNRQAMPVAEVPMRSNVKSNVEGYMLYNSMIEYKSWWNLNTENATSTKLWDSNEIEDVSAGFVIDDTIYAFYYDDVWDIVSKMMMFDLKTGKLLKTIDFSSEDYSQIVLTAAYDEQEQVAYAYTYSDDHNSSYFQKIDITTGEFTYLNEADIFIQDPVLAMAYNPSDGKIYGMTYNGNLCEIDKSTGEYSESLVHVGFYPAYYAQAMVYSPFDGGFVYVGGEDDADLTSRMVVIDFNKKVVSANIKMKREEQYTILYCNDPVVEEGSPMPAEITSITFPELATDGEVAVTLPEETFEGNRLTGELIVEVKIDGVQYGETLTKNVGESFVIELKNMTEGLHILTISTYSAGVKGVDAVAEFYIGKDVPMTPQNVVLTKNKVTWDSVTAGANNGYIEADKISYNVYINDVLQNTSPIATNSYDVVIPDDEIKMYVAAVEAIYEDKVSEKGLSKEYLAGAYTIPADMQMNEDLFGYMTIVDYNADGTTWKYNKNYEVLEYEYDIRFKADDWAIFPPIRIEDAAKVYCVEVDVETYNSNEFTEIIEVGLSKSDDVEEMEIIVPETTLNCFNGTVTNRFNVSEPGDYRIAIHALSEADNYRIRVSSVRVSETNSSTDAPAECLYVTATAAEFGQLNATVKFTMPSLSIKGTKLNENDNITVTITTEAGTTTVTGKPGSSHIEVVPTVQNMNTITLVPSNSAGEGRATSIELYTGVDIPGTATISYSRVSEDNKSVTFGWETSTVGQNGGFVDPAFVQYQIIQYFPEVDYWFSITELFEGTQFTYTIEEDQSLYLERLGVVSVNAAGGTTASEVLAVYLGTPYTMPLKEDFENNEAHYEGMRIEHTGDLYKGTWTVDNPIYYNEAAEHPNDLALIAVSEEELAEPVVASLVLPKFSTKGVNSADVVLNVFYFEGMPQAEVFVRDYTGKEVSMGKITGNEFGKGWNNVTFEMPSEELNKTWVEVVIRTTLENNSQYFIIGSYEAKEHTSIESVNDGEGLAVGAEEEIILKGLQSEFVSIYTLDGKLVFSNNIESEYYRIGMVPGIYVVRFGTETNKVVVR